MNTLILEIKDHMAIITLNRPEKRNALNSELIAELSKTFIEVEDNKDIKVVILKGEGKAFSAGADLSYLQALQKNSYEENLEDSNKLKSLFKKIYTLKKIVIAQVGGHAIAGGCGLVVACDFAFALPEVKLGFSEVKIGFVPAIVMVLLLRKIGEGKAKQLLLTGGIIDAKVALEYGIINDIIKDQSLDTYVMEFAQNLILNNSFESMSLTKRMIHDVQGLSFNEALDYAAEWNAKARSFDDCKKGIEAFLKKSPIKW